MPKKRLVYSIYLGPKVGDEKTDHRGTWKAVAISKNNDVTWECVEEILDPQLQKKIDLHIEPEFTAWRWKLLRNIPTVLRSRKIDSNVFYNPLKKFIRDHALADDQGKLILNPFTAETSRLRLLYRLYLLFESQLRYHGSRLPRLNPDQLLANSLFTKEKIEEENRHLHDKIFELQAELDISELESVRLFPQRPSPVVFESSDEDAEPPPVRRPRVRQWVVREPSVKRRRKKKKNRHLSENEPLSPRLNE